MLKIKNLLAGYDSGFMIRNINLNVEKGEVVTILGPNGSGKTTLLRCITRLLKFNEGNILFKGIDINKYKFKEMAQNIAIVTQNPEYGWMTLQEYILLGRIPYFNKFQFLESKKDINIAEKYMKLTGIIKFKHKYMHEISGGERQLALITRALVQEPELLLLDEPVSHLDITHQLEILDLIRHLNKERELTVMCVLHDLNLASEYSDKLILMNQGKIHSMDTPENVLTYQTIEKVYKTIVITKINPITKKPYVFLVSQNQLKKTKTGREK